MGCASQTEKSRDRLPGVSSRRSLAKAGEGAESSFTYDGKMRRRIKRDFAWNGGTSGWVETNEIHFIYDGNVVVEERNAANVPLVSYTRGNDLSRTLQGAGGIGGLLARTTFGQELPGAPTTSFYHADGKGNITGLIYPLGAVVATCQYDPFGNLISANGSLAAFNKYRFSSKRWDANADLYYYGYRFYDPNLQRWLNRDPIEEWGGWNLYGFVGNSPLDLIDPFGLCGGGGGTMTADGLGGIGESTAGRAIAAAPAVAAEGALGAAAFASMLFAAVTGADNWYETNPNGVNAPPESVESPLPFNRSNLPIRGGPPNGSLSGDYGNGAGQIRDYDPNGNAETDYDFGHDHTGAGDPHAHDWDWTNPNSPDRSAPRPLCPGE